MNGSPTKRPPISDILNKLNVSDDRSVARVIANTFNLYHYSVTSRTTRKSLNEYDIQNIFNMVRVLLSTESERMSAEIPTNGITGDVAIDIVEETFAG